MHLQELSDRIGGTIKFQEIFNANFKEKGSQRLIIKNYRGYKIEICEYGDILATQIKLKSDLSFSLNFSFAINKMDNISFLTREMDISNSPYRVFISRINSNLTLNSDFSSFLGDFFKIIEKLKLSSDESINFYTNGISIALNSNRNLLVILNDTIDLMNNNSSAFVNDKQQKVFAKNVPPNLRHLIPLMKKWSVGDDSEREQMVEETGEKQKKKLIKSVYPFMIEINEFLDSFSDEPLSNEAVLLGNLAELVSELMVDNPAA